MTESTGLTVAVTGPTGDIGRAFLRALDDSSAIARVIGMARRPFNPESAGLDKVEYLQGDILERGDVDTLVKDADVVVHLAFLIFGKAEEARKVNLEGSRNVFEAALDAGARRLVYTSSVAAYGFNSDNPSPLTEDVPTAGSEDSYYSIQKSEVETMLGNISRHFDTDVYVFRPCIVAGPSALSLIEEIPYVKLAEKLPDAAKRFVGMLPVLRPVVPDPGTPFQLVHEDDVASALLGATLGLGKPGAYNLAGDGTLTASDLAHALGWYSIPLPEVALDATAKIVSRAPLMPATVKWGVVALRVPVLMDCTKAKKTLGWEPRYDALQTLADTVVGAREKGLLPWPDRV